MAHVSLSDGVALQAHLEQAKGCKTAATLIPFINMVLGLPDVYVFGELLALPNVKELANGDAAGKSTHRLLEIFAYGKYSIYKAEAASLPKLTERQSQKLKHLTLVALASESRVIPYNTLLTELDVPNLTELGDLIIDALYKNLVVGKLDHEKQQFQVDSTIGRDVLPKDIDRMVSVLTGWEKQTEELLKEIEQKIESANSYRTESEKKKSEYDKKVDDLKGHIKAVMESSMEGVVDPEFGVPMGMMGGIMGLSGLGGFDMGMGARRGRDKNKGGGAKGGGGKHMM